MYQVDSRVQALLSRRVRFISNELHFFSAADVVQIFFIETKFDLVPIVLVSRFDTSRTRFDEIAKLVRRPLHKALVLTGTSPSYSYL